MRSTRRSFVLRVAAIVGAILLSLALTAAPAVAQSKPVVVKANRHVSAGALARADWYVARAEALDVGQGQDGYFELARLYRTAGELRGADTAAVTNFRMAAWAYEAAGDTTVALRMMTRAASLADRLDDVERAIDSYVNAALIAQVGGRHRELSATMREADALLESPRLSAARKVALLQRLQADPVLAALLARR